MGLMKVQNRAVVTIPAALSVTALYPVPLIEISQPVFDAERQIVTGWVRSSAVSGTYTFYRWVDGELILVREIEHDFTEMIVVQDLIDEQMIEVYREEWDGENDENDILDELHKWNDLGYHGEFE